MEARGRRRAAALALAVLVGLTGCAAEDAPAAEPTGAAQVEADCRSAVDTLVTTTQEYVDSVAASARTTTAPDEPAPAGDGAAAAQDRYSRALSGLRSYAASLGCDPGTFRDDLTDGLRGVRAGGPVASAVLLQLRADAAGGVRRGPVRAGGDLAAAVAGTPEGGVVELAAGEFVLPEALALLRSVTLRGAGRDRTTVRGSGDEVLLVLTGDPVVLEGLTLAHAGEQPGGVVSAAPVATLSLTDVRLTGARAAEDGTGGTGLLMAAGAAGQTGQSRRVSLRLADSEAVDNEVAGILLTGEHRGELSRAVVERNGQCGVCFLDRSDGTLSDSRLTGNAGGVVVAGDARPAVRATIVEGGEVGVQVQERAAALLEAVTVRDSSRVAFLFSDSARGSVRASTCERVPVGIVVGPQASPEVQDNNGCELVRGSA